MAGTDAKIDQKIRQVFIKFVHQLELYYFHLSVAFPNFIAFSPMFMN